MRSLISIDMNYVITSIMEVKSKYLLEEYVTVGEVNFIKRALYETFRKRNLSICITDEIDKDSFFLYNDVIFLNQEKNITLSDVTKKFQQLNICMEEFWSEEFIYRNLLELK